MGLIIPPTTTVYSEAPSDDVWRHLRAYTTIENIGELLGRWHESPQSVISDDIAASIEQAGEYFEAAAVTSLSTLPVQIYYGTLSLLRALTLVVSNQPLKINNHGMSHRWEDDGEIVLRNHYAVLSDSRSGGLFQYCSILPNSQIFRGGCKVSLSDSLAVVPEISSEFERALGSTPRAIPILRTLKSDGTIIDRVVNGVNILPDAEITSIPGLSDTYLRPQIVNTTDYLLRPRVGSHLDITILDTSGGRFLSIGTNSNRGVVHVHLLGAHLVSLFLFCSLSRYHPSTWRTFCTTSGRERLLVEDYLRHCKRYIPNEVLNLLEERRFVFTTERVSDKTVGDYVNRSEVEEMVSEAVDKQLLFNRRRQS
ncbi:MAG: hypothetical protein KAW14_04255 [Candidatus Aegiribacteria sp.]|nr:hypothetical protein [Candidatus Aegiribacteria sp.]